MSKKSKLLEKLANFNADSAWTFEDVVWLLEAHGYIRRSGKGSHRVFTAPGRERPIVLAEHGKKIKSGYVRMLREELLNS